MTDDLLGKTIRNTQTGETGTVRSVRALHINDEPGVYVEVPMKRDGREIPHRWCVWNVKVVEVVE